jgi:regulatory protein
MSNVTYLPWVTPEPENVPSDVVAVEPAPVSDVDAVAEALIHDDELSKLDSLVIRKLTAGDLSSGEVRVLLIAQGLPELDADRWLARYERLGYVNDQRLAELLVSTWTDRKGKGRGVIAAEMRRRHISAEICASVLADLDDDSQEAQATELAIARARQLTNLDRATAERRLVGFLSRRGFTGSAVRSAVRAALDSSRNAG